MISIDTNILFYAFASDRPEHTRAANWLRTMTSSEDVLLSELVLVEFYRLLRNPAVSTRPLEAPEAVEVIERYRRHPRWRVAGFPEKSKSLHDNLWKRMAVPGVAYRRIYDARLALVVQQFGVTEFATANVRDFQDFGFNKVWNPVAPTDSSHD